MRVIDRKTANSHQPVQGTGKFRSIHGAHLGITLRQVAIGTLLRFVDADMERAVHRLEPKLGFLNRSWRKHRIAVTLFMPADLPQFTLGDVRRVHKTVISLDQLAAQVVFHLLANDAALRMPEDQTLPVIFQNRKQIELAAKTTVVPFLSLFTLFQP